jgi:hypothetical protein
MGNSTSSVLPEGPVEPQSSQVSQLLMKSALYQGIYSPDGLQPHIRIECYTNTSNNIYLHQGSCLLGRIQDLDLQQNGFLCLSNTHDVSLVDKHIPDAETFASDLQDAVNAVWPTRHRNRYTQATALLLSWQDDNLGVEKEIQGLRNVFEDFYHFHVEEYQIPSDKPASKTQARIMNLLVHDSSDSLFIIYYAGHARPGRQGSEAPIWAA